MTWSALFILIITLTYPARTEKKKYTNVPSAQPQRIQKFVLTKNIQYKRTDLKKKSVVSIKIQVKTVWIKIGLKFQKISCIYRQKSKDEALVQTPERQLHFNKRLLLQLILFQDVHTYYITVQKLLRLLMKYYSLKSFQSLNQMVYHFFLKFTVP